MAAWTALLWRLFPDVRTDERPRFLFFAGLITLISLAQTMGLAGSEALFLAKLGAGRLPPTFIAAALVTVVGSMVYAFRVGVVRNDGLYIRMLLGVGALLVVATASAVAGSLWVLPALLCLWYASDSIFSNHFWTFSGDYFDAHASNRLVPNFTIGSSIGGALGGGIALLLNQFGGATALIAAWGVLLAGAALMLRLGHRPLRRWGPLELEESDETSVEGLRAALGHLRSSSLSRWLVVSALGMVFAFFLAQYLYSGIFERSFPDPQRLAAFLSLDVLVTTLREIVFEKRLPPWLIRRWGVSGANLIHPFLMMLSFGGLNFRYGFAAGVAARMGRELMDNAMAAPVRSLIYNAIPMRFRGKMRAFMEGIVVYGGMAVAGVVLLLLGDPDPRWLCAVGIAASLFYLFANLRVRGAYVKALVSQMRAGRIDFSELRGGMGGWVASRLATLWEQMLREEGSLPSPPLLELIPILGARGVVDPLMRAASHPNPVVRRACIVALADTRAISVAGPLALALDDGEASVRRAALHGLAEIDAGLLATHLDELLDDSDPGVRAEAALHAGPRGLTILTNMIEAPSSAEAIAALGVAPLALLDEVVARARGDDPELRAAALERVAKISDQPALAADELFAALRDPDERVRRAAPGLVRRLDDQNAAPALAAQLVDPSQEVRRKAEEALIQLGHGATAAVEPYLHSDTEASVEAALRVIAARDGPDARHRLHFELRRRVRDLWHDLIAYRFLPQDPDLASGFLRAAYADGIMRNHRLAFRILELLESPSVIRQVDRNLRSDSKRARADALNLLSNLGDREAARLLTPIHEEGPLEERQRAVAPIIQVPESLAAVLDAARRAESVWIRAAARAYDPREGEERYDEEDAMEPLLALRQVDLFKDLSLEQLDAVLRITREAEYLPNEVIVKEGQRGYELYLLMEGSVRYFLRYGEPDQTEVPNDPPLKYFGEMAIFSGETRTATVIAQTRVRLLCLDGDSLKELILQRAEISFELFRVLTQRIKALEHRRDDTRASSGAAAD